MFEKTQTELEFLAKRAARDYIEKNAQLTSTIKKLAVDNNLSSEQIKRVCEMANHEVNAFLLKNASSKLFTFPLADSSIIIKELRSPTPVVDAEADYLVAPKISRMRSGGQVCITLQHEKQTISKEASAIELITRLRQLYADAKHIKLASLRKIADIKNEMYSMVEKMIAAGYKLEDLYLAAKTASSKQELVKDVFSYIADRLKKEGKINHALKISMRKLSAQEDLSGAAGELGKYPIGDHWVKVVMSNGSMSQKFHLLDEAQNSAVQADAAMGHISDVLDMVKTIKN